MSRSPRSAVPLALLLVGATLLVAAPVVSDNVQTNAGGTVTVAIGGTVTIGYRLHATNNDNHNGCNASPANPVRVTILAPAGVTPAVPSIEFVTCGVDQPVSFEVSAPGTHVVKATALGGTGGLNVSPATFSISVTADSTPPSIVPTLFPAAPDGAGGWWTSTVDVYWIVSDDESVVSSTTGCGPTIVAADTAGATLTCTATSAGGTGSASVTVKRDATAPSVSAPASLVLEAAGPGGAEAPWSASATDATSGVASFACAPASGSTFALGSTLVSCGASDEAGNSGTATFLVTVADTTAPILTLPAALGAEAAGPDGAVVTYSASAWDLVDGGLAAECAPVSGSTFALGTTIVACSATDAAGNTATASFGVQIDDTTAPILSLPGDLTLEATGPGGAAAGFAAGATDLVDGELAPDCSPASGATFPLGATTVSCSATDAAGNSASGGFTITVVDATAPSLALPGDITVEAAGPAGAAASWSASAWDLVDGDLAATCDAEDGGTFALGATTVTCSATDAAGNTGSGSFTVTVEDTTPPTLSLPGSATHEATSPAGAAASWSATAGDLVDGDVAVSCSPASGSTFALGATGVECSAVDAAGNAASGSFTITVVDTTPPALDPHDDLVVEATGPAGASVAFDAPAWTDAVDGAGAATCDAASGATFPLGTTIVVCWIVDAAGNAAVTSFSVTVRDTTAPSLAAPASAIAEATGPSGAYVDYGSASATDLVDGAVAATCAPAAGTFALGETTVTCSATDAAGNTASASLTVTVRDTTAPAVTVPAGLALAATSSAGAAGAYAASASDVVDGALSPSCAPPSGSAFALGSTTVTCTATDAAGNTASASFAVQVSYCASSVLQPVNADGSSVFKLGSTIPVKFQMCGASAGIADATARLTIAKVDGLVTGTSVEATSTASSTTGNLFRYDATSGQYIFNLNTKALSKGTWQLTIDLGDGIARTVNVSLR